jgi:hypothetical protein
MHCIGQSRITQITFKAWCLSFGKSSGKIKQLQVGHAIHALLMAIIWLKNDVSQAAVLTALGALPTIKTFFNLGVMELFQLLLAYR